MAAYTDYRISKVRLDLLRSQERSVKGQITELEKKIKQIEQVNTFVNKANQLGLNKTQWDKFYVDIKENPVSFDELKTILAQTSNSNQFYFRPRSLLIQAAPPVENNTAQSSAVSPDTTSNHMAQLTEAIKSATIDENDETSETPVKNPDVVISLDGKFIARRPDIK